MAPRRRGAGARTALTLLLGGALLAACSHGPAAPGPGGTRVPDAVVQDEATCPSPDDDPGTPNPAGTLQRPGRVPDDFVPVAAVECPLSPTVTDHDGTWSAVETVRYTGDLAPLLATLADPDDRPPADLACAAILVIAPPLWLVDADGRAVLVHRPADACGRPKGDVETRLRDLTVESRKTTKIALITPSAALAAHCEEAWKLQPPSTHASANPPEAPGTPVDTLRVCRYDVDPSQEIAVGGGGHVSVGTFVSGGELTGADVARAQDLTRAGALAPSCTTDPTRFAVVLTVAGEAPGEPVWVELDGCRRAWTQESAPRTAPAELLALVGG